MRTELQELFLMESSFKLKFLLSFETSENVDAESFANLLLKSLETYGLDAMEILGQCYDGTAAMNGYKRYKSGVAKRLENVLKKIIPYIHCFNLRLHLIIIHTVKQVHGTKQIFDQLQFIFNFF